MSGIIALMVQTPGLSRVKPALSSAMGEKAAQEFSVLSINAVQSVVASAVENSDYAMDIKCMIAEPDGCYSRFWQGWQCLFAGSRKGLGKLQDTYSQLLEEYDFVLILGCDSPHLSFMHITRAMEYLMTEGAFIIGPSSDGGVYLFGGSQPLSEDFWQSVQQHKGMLSQALCAALQEHACEYTTFETVLDLATVEDLKRLSSSMVANDFLPQQNMVLQWVQKRIPL